MHWTEYYIVQGTMLGVKLLVQNIYRKFNNDDYYNFHDIKEKLKKENDKEEKCFIDHITV